LPKPPAPGLRFTSIEQKIKRRSNEMTRSKMAELINKDGKLLALFTGMLLDGVLLITLVVYAGTLFAF